MIVKIKNLNGEELKSIQFKFVDWMKYLIFERMKKEKSDMRELIQRTEKLLNDFLHAKHVILIYKNDHLHYIYSIEVETEGFIYDRIVGDKKSYLIKLPYVFYVCISEVCKPIVFGRKRNGVEGESYPKFMVTLDRVFISVRKDGRIIRRFWQREGRIKFYLVVHNAREVIERKQIGELSIKFKGFKPVDEKAMEKARRLAKVLKELKQKRELASGKEKARMTKQIKKLEEKIKELVARSQPHGLARFRIVGWIGDKEINEVIEAGIYKSSESASFFGNWRIIYVKDDEDLNVWIRDMEKKWEGFVEEKYTFYGNYGPINHELRILTKPVKRIEVETLTQTREFVWKKLVRIKKYPLKIEEYISKDGNLKIWVMSPLENMTRFVIINKDHKFENLHRVMCHIKKGRYIVFIHEL